MAKRIYVGGLPYSTTDEQLQDMFSAYGAVTEAQIIMDRFSGRSKGFGFVEMENDEDAQNAITALNGSSFGGRNLVVNEARERESGGGGGRSGGGGGGYGGGGGGYGGGGGGGYGGGGGGGYGGGGRGGRGDRRGNDRDRY